MIDFRIAVKHDLNRLVEMLADDKLGKQRECYQLPLPDSYHNAFQRIEEDENNDIVLACIDDTIAGFYQITYIPYLTYQGGMRALVEGVRVSNDFRNRGIGKQMLTDAISRAREKECHLVQLTTDKSRPDAIRFYKSLGFKASHEGMKMHLI